MTFPEINRWWINACGAFLIDIFGAGRTMVRPYILGISPLSTIVCISLPGVDALKSVHTLTDASRRNKIDSFFGGKFMEFSIK
ncbi:MAG: hypothetical protein K2G07_05230 [Muribaculaceae bacterium]|nr:hypothetical protein [Muribaculaceae bacterium]